MTRQPHASPVTGRPVAGIGRVHMWRWGSVWISRDTGRVPPHAHHAIQVTLAPEGSIRIRRTTDASWRPCRGSIVMPDHPHEFDGCGERLAMLFVEPESLAGRALVARFGHAPEQDAGGLIPGVLRHEAARECLPKEQRAQAAEP